MTLTLRHRREDALRTTLDAALQGWGAVIRGSAWNRQKHRIGLSGTIRATEVTLGKNGWHPHLHLLLFLEGKVQEAALAGFQEWLAERWAQKVTSLGARMPSIDRGVDLRLVGSASELGHYLSKVQEKSIGRELARGDLKTGRESSSLAPMDLLDASADDRAAAALWGEYFDATHGRRAFSWSRGLRARLDLGIEMTDDELLDDAERAPECLALIPRRIWDAKCNFPRWLSLLLEKAEEGSDLCPAIGAVSVCDEWIDPLTGELLLAEPIAPSPPEVPAVKKEKIHDFSSNSWAAAAPVGRSQD